MVSDEKMFGNVDNTDEWTTEAYLFYKLTNEPKGSGELKKKYMSCDMTKPTSAQSDQSLSCPHEESFGP